MYSLIITDVDGTLVDGKQRIPAINTKAAERLRSHGTQLSLATGRTWVSAEPFVRQLRLAAPSVLFNGCRIVDPDGRRLYSESLEIETTLAGLDLAREADCTAFLYVDDRLFVERRTERVTAQERKDGVECESIGSLAAHLQRPNAAAPTKILFVGDVDSARSLNDLLSAQLGGRARIVQSEHDYVEILPPGAGKGPALLRLCRILGIAPDRVAAIGDNPNDIDMIKTAGFGAAPANAHPDVLAVADYVAGVSSGDGAFAEIIDHILRPLKL